MHGVTAVAYITPPGNELSGAIILAYENYVLFTELVDFRKYVVFGDLAFSGFWSFLFFVDFCFITDMWRKTPDLGTLGYCALEVFQVPFYLLDCM